MKRPDGITLPYGLKLSLIIFSVSGRSSDPFFLIAVSKQRKAICISSGSIICFYQIQRAA